MQLSSRFLLKQGLTVQEGMAQPHSYVEQCPGESNHANPQPASTTRAAIMMLQLHVLCFSHTQTHQHAKVDAHRKAKELN